MSEAADIDALVATYLDAWNDPSPQARLAGLDACWDEAAVYVDPTVLTVGRRQLSDHIASVHAGRPGSRLEVVDDVQAYRDVVLFRWRRVGPGGGTVRVGTDFCEVGGDGLLTRVVGFF